MFGSIEPTPYDLRFSLAGIPVRVSVWFWVGGCLLGYRSVDLGIQYLIAWLLVLLVSITVHEMGHALVAKAFGYRPRILLYQFGGLAMYEPYGNYTRKKSIAISLAGPAAGFIVYGFIELAARLNLFRVFSGLPDSQLFLIGFVIQQMVWVNLYWGLINLLPVLPLDGGRVCEDVCSLISPRRGYWYAAQLGTFVAGVAAVYFFTNEMTFAAILFAMLCYQNFQMLQQRGRF